MGVEVSYNQVDDEFFGILLMSYHRYGNTFAFVSQVCLVSSVGFAYTQWLWKSLYHKDTKVSVQCLDAAFVADTSILSALNTEMLWKLKLGSLIALVAWLVDFLRNTRRSLDATHNYILLLCYPSFKPRFSLEMSNWHLCS